MVSKVIIFFSLLWASLSSSQPNFFIFSPFGHGPMAPLGQMQREPSNPIALGQPVGIAFTRDTPVFPPPLKLTTAFRPAPPLLGLKPSRGVARSPGPIPDPVSTATKESVSASDAVAAFREGVAAVVGPELIKNHVSRKGDDLIVDNRMFPLRNNTYVVGFGKAVLSMVGPLEKLLGSHLREGIVSVPIGIQKDLSDPNMLPRPNSRIKVFEGAAGNIPDEAAEETTKRIMRLVAGLTPQDFLIVLISGGGSSLFPAPLPPLKLKEKGDLVRSLGKAGATINELNTVRRAISLVKGGGLAQMSAAPILSLILSDVISDPLEVIASGPTVRNPDSPDGAIQVLRRYNLSIPHTVEDALRNKNVNTSDFSHVTNVILGSNRLAIDAASTTLRKQGFVSVAFSSTVQGDAVQLGRHLASLAAYISSQLGNLPKAPVDQKYWSQVVGVSSDIWDALQSAIDEARRSGSGVAVVMGGEPTSTVRGRGVRGGRNQEVALAAGVALEEAMSQKSGDVVVLAGATDGIDGPTPAAGGIAFWKSLPMGNHRSTVTEALAEGLLPKDSLANSDSFTFFRNLSGGRYHLLQGHTGTNVMDLHVLLVKP